MRVWNWARLPSSSAQCSAVRRPLLCQRRRRQGREEEEAAQVNKWSGCVPEKTITIEREEDEPPPSIVLPSSSSRTI